MVETVFWIVVGVILAVVFLTLWFTRKIEMNDEPRHVDHRPESQQRYIGRRKQ